MIWGLKQGLLGVRQITLAPSMAALGRNRYLQQNDFLKMLGVAMLLHAIVIGIATAWPDEKVTDIPVRSLSFKIGAGERIRPLNVGTPVAPQPIQMTPAAPMRWSAPAPDKPKPQPVKQAKVIPITPQPQRQVPMQNPVPQPVAQPAPTSNALPNTNILTSQVAVAASPQRFIRETPTHSTSLGQQPQGATAAEEAQAVRERYEQEISGWIQKHRLPNMVSGSRKVRAVVRVRIDRSGYVRYYALEQSTGNGAIDAAAVDMIRRANPMPAVPSSYPAGNLIEFLIPILFLVP